MAQTKLEIIFPCGYTYRASIKGIGFALDASFSEENLPVCPIHGNKCKK